MKGMVDDFTRWVVCAGDVTTKAPAFVAKARQAKRYADFLDLIAGGIRGDN